MFGIKTFIQKRIIYPSYLFPEKNGKFPSKTVSQIKINSRLFALENKLKEQRSLSGYGNLITYPRRDAINVWKRLINLNPNNLGNWSIREVVPGHDAAEIERDLIFKMVDLYHGDKKNLEGYVTSGGTEANIFSAWVGCKSLQKRGIQRQQMCLIKTSLTHYSVGKAADVVGVPTYVVGLDEKEWSMDVNGFVKKIEKLSKSGMKGFLIPLTLGYTVTGTADPYERICIEIKKLKEQYGVEFFVWMDAALNGLIEPFLNKKFSPFELSEIQIFLTDFHKFGFVPIPSGVVLYRRRLRNLIEKQIDYLDEKDNTLLGSRSGIAPVACWTIINTLGKSGFKKIIKRNLNKKQQFMSICKNRHLSIINSERSLNCGIILKDMALFDKKFSNKYGLNFRKMKLMFISKNSEYNIAKAFFLK